MIESILGVDVQSPPMSFVVFGASPTRLMTLAPDGKIILGENLGVFDLSASPPTFTGDVAASARAFIDAVLALSAARQHSMDRHASDCSVHNMPAYQNGSCDCGGATDSLQDALDFNLAAKAAGGTA